MLRNGRTRLAAVAGVLLVAAFVTACSPDPGPAPVTTDALPPAAADGPTETPTQTPAPVTLPASCAQLYSPAMFAALPQTGPLNDPGMQLPSTQITSALVILQSGIPTLRCTWGSPSGKGFSTNASVVSADQATKVQAALDEAGFTCQTQAAGVLCTVSGTTSDLNGQAVTHGETQYLDGALWVTTAWVGALPDGYTQDIVHTLGR
ncbi:hypothetical protein ABCS02_09005 [Microbacterium sp. X-17]|uniref:hypothetical protein n=1 Tax=Microbacterium sp. X-17 TaxID=3144404 RepID=UPI0031F497E0